MYSAILNDLKKKLLNSQNEEEVRIAWISAFSSNLYIDINAERSRNDASYKNTIIEFKNKGFFKGRTSSNKFKEAVFDRLYKYIVRKAKKENQDTSIYTGIATDGDHVSFCHVINGKIQHTELMSLSLSVVERIVIILQSDTRRALTTENLIDDFGHNSEVGIKLMGALSNELALHFNDENNNKIKMLFEEWKTLFGQISNLSEQQIHLVNKTLNFDLPEIEENSTPGVLFVIHTYNALIMKLLGAEIVSYLDLTQYKDFCGSLSNKNDLDIIQTLRTDIEKSQLFESVGIKGFVEEAIFSWYLDAEKLDDKKNIVSAIRSALIQISFYQMENLSVARSNDVLKGFYHSLIPDVLRKSLGEFYTPDWLVDFATAKSTSKDFLRLRVLDPTCGSGSFLLNIISKKRVEANVAGLSSRELLDNLVNNVWGFDLNPLAVQAARVNFLIAISDLIIDCPGITIELPILLADSVYSPAHIPIRDDEIVEYRIGSTHADLLIKLPAKLAFDRERLDLVFEEMGKSVERTEEFITVQQKLLRKSILSEQEVTDWSSPLAETYNRVLQLHQENWNGIWFRIVRNFFWSATAGKFDLIVGNPPWVRWSSLPKEYSEKIKPICEQYTIFSDTPYHGGNELDISGMLTYTVADKWLKTNGQLIFVITQTHFQTPSSQGFRSFKIDEETSLFPLEVDDLKGLKPFPDAANKTAIASFKKVLSAEVSKDKIYPVKYNVWSAANGYTRAIPEKTSRKEILKRVVIEAKEANPVDDFRSPWAIMLPNNFELTSDIRGASDWVQGRKGITADLNGIYFVEILDQNSESGLVKIETRPHAGKKDIGQARVFWVEPDLLYPLVKGASDFSSCFFKPKNDLYVFVPNKGITKKYMLKAEDIVENDLPKTQVYFNHYKELLEQRSTYKQRLQKFEYYMIYNVGDYTFSPYKVIWAEQSSKFEAAVISSKEMPLRGTQPYVPDHKIFFVDCDNKNTAFYLCGLLSAPLVKEYIESHTISIQVGNVFKHLKLPLFEKNNKQHRSLADAVEKAHGEEDAQAREKIVKKVERIATQVLNSSGK